MNNFIKNTKAQAMTEYILIIVLIILISIPAIKLILKAFASAFKKITTFHSYHIDDLTRKVSSIIF